jgi:hypothetical protein
MFLALKKALNPQNICKGFKTTGIWPLDPSPMESKMQPNEQFVQTKIDFQLVNLQVKEVLGECDLTIDPNACQYYVEM